MYFVYSCNINKATQNDYSIDCLVQWFGERDLTNIWNELTELHSLLPSKLAVNLLSSSDWVDDFREYCEFTEEENENLSCDNLIDQCSEILIDPLTNYFEAYWDDLMETYENKDE